MHILKNSLLFISLVTLFTGCSGGGSPDNIEGITVDTFVFSALESVENGESTQQICNTLENEYRSESEITIVNIENGEFSECNIQSDWRNSCQTLGTYKGNKVSMDDGGFEVVMTMSRVNSSTLRIEKASVDGQNVNVEDFMTEDDRTARVIEEEDISTLVTLLSGCSF